MTTDGPASNFEILVDSIGVTCKWGGRIQHIDWAAIEEIAILTTADGPIGLDVWLALTGSGEGCQIPDEAPGFRALVFNEIRDRFPEINWSKLTEAMSHTDLAKFVLWSRNAAPT